MLQTLAVANLGRLLALCSVHAQVVHLYGLGCREDLLSHHPLQERLSRGVQTHGCGIKSTVTRTKFWVGTELFQQRFDEASLGKRMHSWKGKFSRENDQFRLEIWLLRTADRNKDPESARWSADHNSNLAQLQIKNYHWLLDLFFLNNRYQPRTATLQRSTLNLATCRALLHVHHGHDHHVMYANNCEKGDSTFAL